MSSENLSQNDSDLLAGAPVPPARPAAEREAVPYDFRRPHRIPRERLRTLESMYERLVRSLEGWMLGRVRGGIELTLQGVELLGFGEYALQLPSPCCAYLVDVHDAGGQQGVIHFGPELACFLVERFLGGRGEVLVVERTLTPIERQIVRIAAERVGQCLVEVWADHVRLELGIGGFESVPEILRSAGGDEPVLVASVGVVAAGAASRISICLPFAVLDRFFADAGTPRRGGVTGSEQEREANRRLIEESLRVTSVPMSARLPEFRISMRTLTQLREGMVLETGIPQAAEVQVLVAGDLRYTGSAAKVGRKLAVSVEEVLVPEPDAAAPQQPNKRSR